MIPNRFATLWTVFGLQGVCALFFLADSIGDLLGRDDQMGFIENDMFEYAVTFALIVGVLVTGREIIQMRAQQTRMENQIMAASGAFGELLEAYFEDWNLTASERDVALLAIKGLSIADMARVRDTKEGTVKAQCAAIYRKANVRGRTQLLSVFIEDLMADTLIPSPSGGAST
ncbi:MAG: LuxR C-terminal-related transcriptional regulator [Pseudomonadota bacterium]